MGGITSVEPELSESISVFYFTSDVVWKKVTSCLIVFILLELFIVLWIDETRLLMARSMSEVLLMLGFP